jgi:serine phosphatase RsbU (regulator of sigma subunit)
MTNRPTGQDLRDPERAVPSVAPGDDQAVALPWHEEEGRTDPARPALIVLPRAEEDVQADGPGGVGGLPRVERIEERLAVLAKAGWVLGASLDCRRTLQDLSEVGLGLLGVLCAVGLVDPAKRALLKGLHDVPLALRSQSAAGVHAGTPCVLNDVDDGLLRAALACDADLTLVRQLGLGPTMIVPLTVRRETVGVLVFSAAAGSDPYGPGDVALAEELARRAAVAVDNARLFSQTSEVAHTLQESLLPPRLPQIPGIEIAARYHPAGEHPKVGGDFYDAFSIGADHWGFLIGDVAGKGAGAAAVTAVVRHTARATARQGAALGVPAAVNEALLEAEQAEHFATMIYGQLRFGAGEASLDLLNCGHPAPLVVRSGGRIDEIEGHGPLLGQLPVIEVDPVTVTLLPGDVLVLVTDGVLEARAPQPRRGRGAPRFLGNAGLAAVLNETRDQPAEVIAREVEERTVAYAGGRPGDDLAILVIRVPDA